MTKHTEGEWEFHPAGDNIRAHITADQRVIATIIYLDNPADGVLMARAPGLLGVCESLVEWHEGLVKEYESAANERTEWVGMSEFEALLQDDDDDLVVNDPVLTAIIDLARTHIAKAHGNAAQTEASQ